MKNLTNPGSSVKNLTNPGKQFVPPDSQQVSLAGQAPGVRKLGQTSPVQMSQMLSDRPANITKPQQMGQAGGPRGAHEIPVVGMTPQAPVGRVAPRHVPPSAPQLSAPLQQALPAPALAGSEDVVVVEVVGQGPDGKEYVAPFEAVFPRGTKILGTRFPK